ncbi:MAG TPA: CehA/McbA family metallohydrolase [Labilithrix sp.]|nr:CehA/McbA family metallohydrolase [Labilithrix sp.]
MRTGLIALAGLAVAGCSRPPERPAEATDASAAVAAPAPTNRAPLPPGFMKGQLHTHSSGSGDSQTSPVDVQRWYEARGYDFVVFTDHNRITDTPDSSLLTIPGAELTRNLQTCEPPPPPGVPCAFHVNVLFATAGEGPVNPGDAQSGDRVANYRVAIASAKALGGLAVLNHPNMMSGADSEVVGALAREGLSFLEVGNQAWDAENAGDAQRKSTEAIWDAALAKGFHVFATATDDAHHYADAAALRERGKRPFVGDLGFVVVRAERDAAAIRAAMDRGDFYASTGIVFETHERTATSLVLVTRAEVDYESVARDGSVTRREHGTRFEVTLGPQDGPYVRARARRADGAFALTQPVFRRPASRPQGAP